MRIKPEETPADEMSQVENAGRRGEVFLIGPGTAPIPRNALAAYNPASPKPWKALRLRIVGRNPALDGQTPRTAPGPGSPVRQPSGLRLDASQCPIARPSALH